MKENIYVTWDPKGNEKSPELKTFFPDDKSWNQTLVSKINEIASKFYVHDIHVNQIFTSELNKKIFEDLEYYDPIGKALGSRYAVTFLSDLPSNLIILCQNTKPEYSGSIVLIDTQDDDTGNI